MYNAYPSVPSGVLAGLDRVRGSDLKSGASPKVAEAQLRRVEVRVG